MADKPSPVDRLLSGLDALSGKIDGFSKRLDQVEQRARPAAITPDLGPDDDMPDSVPTGDDPDEKTPTAPLPEGLPAPTAADASLNAIRTRRAKLASFQARADAVASLFGSHAARPLEGESVNGYVRRTLRNWQPMNEQWKGIDLDGVRGGTLAVAAADIMRTAADEARNPKVPVGRLMSRTRDDGAGHRITEHFGSPSVWMNRHAGPRKYVQRINVRPTSGYQSPAQ